jgi:hypothetical protein
MRVLVLSIFALVLVACAGFATPEAREHQERLARDTECLVEDLGLLTAQMSPALRQIPEVAKFLGDAHENPVLALAALPQLLANQHIVAAGLVGALRVVEKDLQAVVEDLEAIARDADGGGS